MILEKRQLEKQSAKQNIFPKRIAIETKKYLTRKPEQENLIFQIKKKHLKVIYNTMDQNFRESELTDKD